jgi:hypothetical protein
MSEQIVGVRALWAVEIFWQLSAEFYFMLTVQPKVLSPEI